jgi:hypothetical protein
MFATNIAISIAISAEILISPTNLACTTSSLDEVISTVRYCFGERSHILYFIFIN